MSISFGERVYRVSMQLVTMKDVVNEARILENVDTDISLVAMFFYDETELQEYIKKNEDYKWNSSCLPGELLGSSGRCGRSKAISSYCTD